MRTLKKCKDLGASYCSYDIWLPYLVKLPGAPIDEYDNKRRNLGKEIEEIMTTLLEKGDE